MEAVYYVVLVCGVIMTIGISAQDDYIRFTADEEEPKGTYIGNIATKANISGQNLSSDDAATLEYRLLVQNNPHSELFHINERDGTLFVASRIDRESICEFVDECILLLDVICRTASANFYKKIKIAVNITDINDNVPSFGKLTETLEMSEGSLEGSSVPIPGAVDKDAGNFSVQTYSIVPDDTPFRVEFQKNADVSSVLSIPQIVLNRKLDREARSSYNFQVIAKDGGNPPKSGSLSVTLNVLDINDNPPVFEKPIYNITVNEDIGVNKTITILNATDKDQGENGRVVYRMSPRQDSKIFSLFAVTESGEVKVISSLVSEPGELYRMYVIASDNAKQPLMAQAEVHVNVKDTHNNRPSIKVDLLSNTDKAEVVENGAENTAVAHVTVTDPDTGLNGFVNCSVVSDEFKLQRFDVHEYKVVAKRSFDREMKQEYEVTVGCKDAGTPPLNSSFSFIVRVMDENDNAPYFSKNSIRVEVKENNDIGAGLVRVSANDFDAGKNAEITYELQPSVYDFRIDPKSGMISAYFRLDRETTSMIQLKVFAVDGGTQPKTGTVDVVIEIKDINDNKPEFQNQSFEFAISEHSGKDATVGLLIATDKDLGDNKKIIFSLLTQDVPGTPFDVLPNGTIIATDDLDRETIDKYQFTVVASDSGDPVQQSSAKVTVTVLDINDQSPYFVFPSDINSTIVISYQTLPNTVIAKLDTHDGDEGLNAKVTYFATDKKYSDMFQINSISGRIVLIKALTTEDIGKYTFGIFASDKGTPPQITEKSLTVVVTNQPLANTHVTEVQPEDHKYFLIAIAMACVTIVIAIVIILTICLIKRADRQKMKYLQSQQDEEGRNGGNSIETTKKVSFANDGVNITHNQSSEPHTRGQDKYQYPTCIQIQTKGLTANLGTDERIRHQLSSLQIQQAYEKQRSGQSPFPSSSLRYEGDDNSENSGELTTSDSGRGGSDEDLHNSTVLSCSMDFDDHVKQIPSSSKGRRAPIHNNSKGNSKEKKSKSSITLDSLLSPILNNSSNDKDRLYHYDNTNRVLYNKSDYFDLSHTGSSMYNTGHDDSTTTSGSYTLEDPDDEYVVLPSKQCIV